MYERSVLIIYVLNRVRGMAILCSCREATWSYRGRNSYVGVGWGFSAKHIFCPTISGENLRCPVSRFISFDWWAKAHPTERK